MGASGGPKNISDNLQISLDFKDDTLFTDQYRVRNLGNAVHTGSLYSGVHLESISASTHYVDCGTNTGDALGNDYPGSLTFTCWIQDNRPLGGGGFGEGQNLASLINIGHKDGTEHGRFMCSLASSIEHSTQKMTMMVGNNTKNVSCDWPDSTRGHWHHVAYVYSVNDAGASGTTGTTDGSGAQIYIDGVEQDPSGPGNFPATNDLDFSGRNTSFGAYFAANGGGNYNINGVISDYRLYNTALNKTQVNEIVERGTLLPSGISGSNLVGYWPMTEGSGDIVHDGSGNHATGSLKNAMIFTSGSKVYTQGYSGVSSENGHLGGFTPQLARHGYNRKMHFGMDSGFVRVANSDDINAGTSDFSIMVWWNGETKDGGAPIMIFNAYPKGYRIVDGATGNYRFSMFEQWFVSGEYANIDIPKVADIWNCLIISADRDGDVNCYVNGINRASTDISFMQGDISEDGQDLYIGSVLPTLAQDRANGIIDEVCFWKSALSISEVQALYQTGSFGRPNPPDARNIGSNLKMYLRNGGTQTNDWIDLSGNGNHGIVSQSAAGALETMHILDQNDRDSLGFIRDDTVERYGLNLNRMSGSASGLVHQAGNQYMKISKGDVGALSDPMTYSLWYKSNAETPGMANRVMNFAVYTDSSNFFEHILTDPYYASDGVVEIWAYSLTGGARNDFNIGSLSTIPYNKDQWKNIIITLNDGTGSYYHNGDFIKKDTWAYRGAGWDSDTDHQSPIFLGTGANYHYYNTTSYRYGDCTIGKYDIWHKELNDEEARQHFNQFKSRFDL